MNQRGFTLIEALVTLILFSLAVVPMLVLATFITNTASTIRDDMVAAHLAQEGLEVTRAIRDSNWFNGQAFDSGLGDGVYRVEYNSDSLLALSGNPVLNLANGIYSYAPGGTATIFQRTITITKINAGELRVLATVTRKDRGNTTKTINAESHLFDWR